MQAAMQQANPGGAQAGQGAHEAVAPPAQGFTYVRAAPFPAGPGGFAMAMAPPMMYTMPFAAGGPGGPMMVMAHPSAFMAAASQPPAVQTSGQPQHQQQMASQQQQQAKVWAPTPIMWAAAPAGMQPGATGLQHAAHMGMQTAMYWDPRMQSLMAATAGMGGSPALPSQATSIVHIMPQHLTGPGALTRMSHRAPGDDDYGGLKPRASTTHDGVDTSTNLANNAVGGAAMSRPFKAARVGAGGGGGGGGMAVTAANVALSGLKNSMHAVMQSGGGGGGGGSGGGGSGPPSAAHTLPYPSRVGEYEGDDVDGGGSAVPQALHNTLMLPNIPCLSDDDDGERAGPRRRRRKVATSEQLRGALHPLLVLEVNQVSKSEGGEEQVSARVHCPYAEFSGYLTLVAQSTTRGG